MFTVTSSALERLHQAIEQRDAPQSSCFRIVQRDNKTLGLAIEDPKRSDETYEFNGATVLAVPDSLSEFCQQRTLDVDTHGQLVLL